MIDKIITLKAFATAQFGIASSIRLLLSLPIDKVDRLSLQTRLCELGLLSKQPAKGQ